MIINHSDHLWRVGDVLYYFIITMIGAYKCCKIAIIDYWLLVRPSCFGIGRLRCLILRQRVVVCMPNWAAVTALFQLFFLKASSNETPFNVLQRKTFFLFPQSFPLFSYLVSFHCLVGCISSWFRKQVRHPSIRPTPYMFSRLNIA